MHHLLGWSVLIERDTATLIGAAGMVLLGAAWWWRERSVVRLAQTGWILVGVYFFSQAWTYHSHSDPILTVMSALTLPLSCLAAWWEETAVDQRKEAIVWARGTVAFAGGPYLLISYVPYLSVLAIWFVASQSAWFLGFATGQDIEIGTTWVNDPSGRVSWEAWEGNRWFATDFTSEYAFQSELLLADGTMIGINFVLACTAIQSMVLFIGAISVLNMSWKKRTRALLLVIPTIHALNVFRNAGLIWMHMTYTLGLVGIECVRIRPQLCCSVCEPLRHVSVGADHVRDATEHASKHHGLDRFKPWGEATIRCRRRESNSGREVGNLPS